VNLGSCTKIKGNWDYLTARNIGEMDILGSVTDVAYSFERKQLVVLTYTGIFFFNVQQESDLYQPPFHRLTGMFGQCEAICYDDEHLVITNEDRDMWRIPLKTALTVNTISRPLPKMSIKKAEKAPTLDGKFDDWDNAEIITLQPDNAESKITLRIQWYDTGLYLSGDIKHPNKWEGTKKSVQHGALIATLSPKMDAPLFSNKSDAIFVFSVDQKEDGLHTKVGRIYANMKSKYNAEAIAIPNKQGSTFEVYFDTAQQFKEKWQANNSFRFNLYFIEVKEDKELRWFWSNKLSNNPYYFNYLFMPNLGGTITLIN
jgi:hypothetical protein